MAKRTTTATATTPTTPTTKTPRAKSPTATTPAAKSPTNRSRRPPSALPEQLPAPEVLLGCLFFWSAAAYTDRPDDIVPLVRAALPATLTKTQARAAAKWFVQHVGVVHWSPKYACLWFRQGNRIATDWVVDPSRLSHELRARVTTADPPTKPLGIHTASRPLGWMPTR